MTDLFQAATQAARPAPKAVAGLNAMKPSGRYVPDRGSSHFVHDCACCGHAHAPFGFRASLLSALRSGDASRAGVYLCGACRDLVLAEEVAA